LISQNKDENNRKFIISFFCGDDTIQVYQNADKNSGIWGGKFLERKKHEHKIEGRYLVDTDFQIGSIVNLGAYNFQLLKADDFTLNYMRERPDKYPEVGIESALNEIKALAKNHKSYNDFLIWFVKSTFVVIQTSTPKTEEVSATTISVVI
jgi:EF-hand domain-containing protein 1